MQKSPCERCGRMVTHTDDDIHPLCRLCTDIYAASRLIQDIAHGRVTIPPQLHDEEGNLVE